ncbi:MAG: TolB family protein [Candidatus Binatia bacterium]
MNLDGSQQRRIAVGTAPDWSPDGKRIAFVRFLDPDGDDAYEPWVFIMNADGSGVRQIAEGSMPAWSPDGRWLAFAATSTRDYDCTTIRIWELNGPGIREVGVGCFDWYPDWSPDGEQIVFSSSRDWNTLDIGIYVANSDGTNVRRLTPEWDGSEPRSMLNPSWSSDGRRIAYMLTRTDRGIPWDRPIPTAERRGLTRTTQIGPAAVPRALRPRRSTSWMRTGPTRPDFSP